MCLHQSLDFKGTKNTIFNRIFIFKSMDNTFRTILKPQPSEIQIDHKTDILCIGSCFAEHIATRLEDCKIPICLNPFGIIYNPISISKGIEILLEENHFFKEEDLFQHLGGWHSFYHHGNFSNPKKEFVLEKINNALTDARKFLQNADFLIITLGTANVFFNKNIGEVVANCHKVAQQEFLRKKLTVDEITTSLSACFEKINNAFPEIKIITTVSPVRHIRDGLRENKISKSKLLLALDILEQKYANVNYFPAYEIIQDDLRDYRFYKKDMIHPNEMAVDYIWNHFGATYFSKKTKDLNTQIDKIKSAVAHRPFHPTSTEHLEFIKKQINKMEEMEKDFPFLNFDLEKEMIRN